MKSWLIPALITMVLWGAYGFLPKITTQHITPSSAIIYETLGGLLIGIIALWYLGFTPDFNKQGFFWAFLTGFIGVAGALTYLIAAQHGRISVVSATIALYPVITILLGVFFLNETVSLKKGVGMCFALAAILLLTT